MWPRRKRTDADFNEEIQANIALDVDRLVEEGKSPVEARAAALRSFGNVTRTQEQFYESRRVMWLNDAGRDLKHAARVLRRDPLLTLTAVLSLAIGIGANTTVLTLANTLLFQSPAGVIEPNRLVDIGTSRNGGGFGSSSYPNYLDVRQRTTTLEDVYACPRFPRPMSLGVEGASGAERVFGNVVTMNYFAVLGAAPAIGRLFVAGDSEQPGASPIAVLSYGFWTRRFNRDPAIVGQTLTLSGYPFTVIGVASEGFHGADIRAGDLWVPMSMIPVVSSEGTAMLTNRASAWLLIGGRLKAGVSTSQAAAEMDVIGRALELAYPDQNRDRGLRVQTSSPVPGNNVPVGIFMTLLMAIVSLVMVIACANLAGLLLARSAARRREIAVRLAMGAGRARLIRQLLAETLVLFTLGGIAGVPVARGLLPVLVSRLPTLPFPVDLSLVLDGRVLALTAALVFVTALAAGLAPALQASKVDVVSALKNDVQVRARLRLRHAFVVGQVAFSLLLVVVAGLFVRALQAAGSSDPGFDPHGVELASLVLSQAGYTDTTGPPFARDLVNRVRALPDVEGATLAAVLPGGFETQERAVSVPGVTPQDGQPFFGVDWNVVEPGYFATLRIPLAAGRDFNNADLTGTEPVAIVGEGSARQFFPGQDAVGRYILEEQFGPNGRIPNGAKTLRVVGVARDVKASSLIDGLSGPIVYVPLQQAYTPAITIVARSARGQRLASQIGALIARTDPNLPIVTTQTLEESTALGLVPQQIALSLSGSLGLVGLVLAAIGIYGVTAYAVTRRTREIGIRVALGAQRGAVVGMILRQGMSLAAVGAAIGLLLAAAAGRVLTVFLLGAPPLDPLIFGGAAVLFAGVGLAACYVPARRATRIEAIQALRYE